MVNTYAAQSGGCRFESLWGFGFSLKGAYYEVGYCGKKTFLAGLQCTLTSSCAKTCTKGFSITLQGYKLYPLLTVLCFTAEAFDLKKTITQFSTRGIESQIFQGIPNASKLQRAENKTPRLLLSGIFPPQTVLPRQS